MGALIDALKGNIIFQVAICAFDDNMASISVAIRLRFVAISFAYIHSEYFLNVNSVESRWISHVDENADCV